MKQGRSEQQLMGFAPFSSVFMLLVWIDAQVDETKSGSSEKGKPTQRSETVCTVVGIDGRVKKTKG